MSNDYQVSWRLFWLNYFHQTSHPVGLLQPRVGPQELLEGRVKPFVKSLKNKSCRASQETCFYNLKILSKHKQFWANFTSKIEIIRYGRINSLNFFQYLEFGSWFMWFTMVRLGIPANFAISRGTESRAQSLDHTVSVV